MRLGIGILLLAASAFGQTYPAGTRLELLAVPQTGATFSGWSGGLTGTQNPAEIVITADTSVTATFSGQPPPDPPQDPTLTVNVVGPGSVTITVVPPGPVCGNGTIESGEECDDGNTASGDGCSATCQTEPPPGGGDLATAEWKSVPGSEMMSIYDPAIDSKPTWPPFSFQSIQSAWGGTACAEDATIAGETADWLVVLGGGHTDGAHNGVFAVRVDGTTNPDGKYWRRVTLPSPTWQASNPSAPNYCPANMCTPPFGTTPCDYRECNVGPDGAPVARHTYDSITSDGQFVYSVMGSVYPGGSAGVEPRGWKLKLSNGQWTPLPERNYGDGTYTSELVNGAIYEIVPFFLADRLNIAAGTWMSPRGDLARGLNYGTQLLYVPSVSKFFALGHGHAWALPLANWPNGASDLITSTGHLSEKVAPGVLYYPPDDLILLWDGGRTIETLSPTTPYTWGSLTLPGEDPGPPLMAHPDRPNYGGTYGRFAYCGGRVVLLNGVDKPLHYLAPQAPTQPPPDQSSNFEERCTAAGVVFCDPLDNEGPWGVRADGQRHLMPNPDGTQGIPVNSWWRYWRGVEQSPNAGSVKPRLDTAIKASGTGSLKFDVSTRTDQGGAGIFTTNFSDDLSQQFDEGDSFYVQYRIRYDCDFIYTDCDPGSPSYKATRRFYAGSYDGSTFAKLDITATGDPSIGTSANACTSLEVVKVHSFDHVLQGYHACGDYEPFHECMDAQCVNIETQPGSAFDCWYHPTPVTNWAWGNTGPSCFQIEADNWLTVQTMIRIGTWSPTATGPKTSHVTIWAAHEGEPQVKVVDVDLHLRGPSAATPWEKYGKIWFGPYMTGKDAAEAHPTGHVWYDELIVSRNFIADPK